MAIFTKQTQFTEKYFEEYTKMLRAVPKDELEEQFKQVFGFYENYNEFYFDFVDKKNSEEISKFDLARWDFQKFIEVILDRYQNTDYNLTASEEEIDNALQVVLEPFRSGDVLFYSRNLINYRKGKVTNNHIFNKDIKFPKDIVKELEREKDLSRADEIFNSGDNLTVEEQESVQELIDGDRFDKEMDDYILQCDKEEKEYLENMTPEEVAEMEELKAQCLNEQLEDDLAKEHEKTKDMTEEELVDYRLTKYEDEFMYGGIV